MLYLYYQADCGKRYQTDLWSNKWLHNFDKRSHLVFHHLVSKKEVFSFSCKWFLLFLLKYIYILKYKYSIYYNYYIYNKIIYYKVYMNTNCQIFSSRIQVSSETDDHAGIPTITNDRCSTSNSSNRMSRLVSKGFHYLERQGRHQNRAPRSYRRWTFLLLPSIVIRGQKSLKG